MSLSAGKVSSAVPCLSGRPLLQSFGVCWCCCCWLAKNLSARGSALNGGGSSLTQQQAGSRGPVVHSSYLFRAFRPSFSFFSLPPASLLEITSPAQGTLLSLFFFFGVEVGEKVDQVEEEVEVERSFVAGCQRVSEFFLFGYLSSFIKGQFKLLLSSVLVTARCGAFVKLPLVAAIDSGCRASGRPFSPALPCGTTARQAR